MRNVIINLFASSYVTDMNLISKMEEGIVESRFKNSTVFITGAASGLGLEAAHALSDEGARVAVADLNGEAAGVVAEAIGLGASARTVDVASETSVRALVEAMTARYGAFDVVVNGSVFPFAPPAAPARPAWRC
jgi:3-oxoacyl-[acyl-carrier protein] reductase